MNLSLAEVDFQTRVQVSGRELPCDISRALETLPFPNNNLTYFDAETEISGFKHFSLNDYRCLAYFFNDGRLDRYQRPLLSARVLLIQHEVLAESDPCWWHAELIKGDLAQQLASRVEAWQDNKQADPNLKALLRGSQLPTATLIQAVVTFIQKGKLAILGLDPTRRLDLFHKLVRLIPNGILRERDLCTFAAQLDGRPEHLICCEGQVQAPAKKWFGLFESRKNENQNPMVDSDSGLILAAASDRHADALIRAYQALGADSPWPELSGSARYDLFLQIITQLACGQSPNPGQLKTELDPRTLTQGLEILKGKSMG